MPKVNVARVVDIPKLYARPKTLCEAFDMSRSEVVRLTTKMRESIAYREYVIAKSRMILVRIDAFEKFIKHDAELNG